MAHSRWYTTSLSVFRNLIVLLILSGCSATHRFQYHYTLIAPPGGATGVIEDEQARVRLTPAAGGGVMHLEVTNKSPQPIAIVWSQSYYLDPLGRRRQAFQTDGQQLVHSPGWFVEDTLLLPGSEMRTTVRPGTLATARPPDVGRIRSPADPRLPPEDDSYTYSGTGQVSGPFTLNPFTASRYASGEVVVSSAPPAFLPATGKSPTLGPSYEGRTFRFVVTLQHSEGITPYAFTFQITDVQVE